MATEILVTGSWTQASSHVERGCPARCQGAQTLESWPWRGCDPRGPCPRPASAAHTILGCVIRPRTHTLTLLTEHILPKSALSGAPDGAEAAHSLGARGVRSSWQQAARPLKTPGRVHVGPFPASCGRWKPRSSGLASPALTAPTSQPSLALPSALRGEAGLFSSNRRPLLWED